MMVATTKGLCMSDIGKALGFAVSTTSRYFKNLSDIKSKTELGYGLLYNYRDPQNNRRRLVVLSSKGRELLEQLTSKAVLTLSNNENVVPQNSTWGNFKIRSNKRSQVEL